MPLPNLSTAATPPINPQQGQDPLEQLRLMQIMGGGTPPNQGAPTPIIPPAGLPMGMDPAVSVPTTGAVNTGYQPETEASDRFNEMLQNYPESEKRGMLEKIALSMLALDNPELVQQIMKQPSQEQLDWGAQIGPSQAAAGQEGSRNINLFITHS